MFSFKQFDIDDSHCGMKVGTDGVLLGAWSDVRPGDVVWDAGAGSGVISIMAMQRGASRCVAFEIDEGACRDARRNIAACRWVESIELVPGDFMEQSAVYAGGRPDLIVSNPPFFTETLHSPTAERAAARHEGALGCAGIMAVAARCLAPGGRLALIAPAMRLDELQYEARIARLWPLRICEVSTVEGKNPKRVMCEWAAADPHRAPEITALAIRCAGGASYGQEYLRITGEFYL